MSARWTQAVLRHRVAVAACWLIVLSAGVVAATRLHSLLANSFAIPGTESAHAGAILSAHFGERPESTFVVVLQVRRPSDQALARRLQRGVDAAATKVPTAASRKLERGGGILYGDVVTRLELPAAKSQTDALRRALRAAGASPALVTGPPAIARDLEPVLAADLRRGELLAVPLTLVILVAAFGVSAAIVIPFVFAACTVAGALLATYLVGHELTTPSYATNLTVLIGFGLSVDYSLLLVHRFREELENGRSRDTAVARTMETAGRTIVFSGTAVAVGLALLLLVPVPFVRALGVAAMLVPVVAVAGAVTLQPVLLSVVPLRGIARPGGADRTDRFWVRFGGLVVRRRRILLTGSVALLLLFAAPALWIRLVPGSFKGIPAGSESARGLALLQQRVSAGAVTPIEITVDAGPGGDAAHGVVARAARRLSDELFHDPDVLAVASGSDPPYTDATHRYARVVAIARQEYGSPASQAIVHDLRGRLIRRAAFPATTSVAVGGAPAQGVDFLAETYGSFPWLVLGVVLLSLAVLVRAFRSLVLPFQALFADLLTVGAVYGVLVIVFQWGIGAGLLGAHPAGDVEGWIPIFLFAVLFGLSMDYEMFVVRRIREEWDESRDGEAAVARGVARTGRVVTATALVMAAALLGFVTGSVRGLQELGLGLALAVLLDATVVRMLLVPSLVAVSGRWSWWLPPAVAGLVRVPAAPLAPRGGSRP
jgi:RND superfamily putative drug exporter